MITYGVNLKTYANKHTTATLTRPSSMIKFKLLSLLQRSCKLIKISTKKKMYNIWTIKLSTSTLIIAVSCSLTTFFCVSNFS